MAGEYERWAAAEEKAARIHAARVQSLIADWHRARELDNAEVVTDGAAEG